MVKEASDTPFTRIAIPGHASGGPRHEYEGAFGVERVVNRRTGEGTMHMKIIFTNITLVGRTHAYLLAPITLEGHIGVLEFELVLWVAEMGYLIVFHGFT
uniref:Uncharacterized protein n=1 Tax=Opuntia streptacantha TaxID=393608 RepID=A0A7C9DHJ8_OPUST